MHDPEPDSTEDRRSTAPHCAQPKLALWHGCAFDEWQLGCQMALHTEDDIACNTPAAGHVGVAGDEAAAVLQVEAARHDVEGAVVLRKPSMSMEAAVTALRHGTRMLTGGPHA